ncbi:hypothetical protein RRG08_041019 [Elysia crispata]|uniref:Uncharacterized protein n=1 Tax=Elysia crispata TaxID=231223 RepID=A0AAE1EDB1_9GAST|nr:hypothetical protein RRG08_041019 [Elysia crispata]
MTYVNDVRYLFNHLTGHSLREVAGCASKAQEVKVRSQRFLVQLEGWRSKFNSPVMANDQGATGQPGNSFGLVHR